MRSDDYVFEGGYPTADTVRRAYDDGDLTRAVSAYKFFYPTVSAISISVGNIAAGMVDNRVYGIMRSTPEQQVFTPNSDTPYAGLAFDLSDGPVVLELPPGPLMCSSNDLNQRWVMDMGLPGPDRGRGGKHVFLPPGYDGEVPEGFHVGRSTTNRVLVMLRGLPPGADPDAAVEMVKTVTVYPLGGSPGDWPEPEWASLSEPGTDMSPLRWETTLEFWKQLHGLIDSDPPYEPYRAHYGELAELGIVKGRPFEPDERMTAILENAARIANAQMRVQAFADRRPDRLAWPDQHWEWAVLRPENGTFDAPSYVDLTAREKWFYQAQIESPAMFARHPGAGSLYWLSTRDSSGTFLNGANTYQLEVPQPVPAKLFWSITVYDTQTRSEIATDQNQAALRSLFELANAHTDTPTVLHFGPNEPPDAEGRWIKTIPGKGWFVFFRIYGPDAAAFDSTWQLPDFTRTD